MDEIEVLRAVGNILLVTSTVVSIACAIVAWDTFRLFRNSKAAKYKVVGYTLLAIAFTAFLGLRIIDLEPIERTYATTISFGVLVVGLIFLWLGMLDLNTGMHGKALWKRLTTWKR